MKHWLTLLFLLPPLCFAASNGKGGGKPPKPPATPTNLWSDAKTWGGTVPAPGSAVVIPHDKLVILDTSISVASLELHGRLEIARKDLSIDAGFIMLHGGELIAGTEAAPFTQRLTITLTGTDPNAIPGMGGRALAVMGGGRIELIGAATKSWTMLAPNATANAGDSVIMLAESPGWKTGDSIIITSTDFDYAQTEQRAITGIVNNVVSLSAPLAFQHYGVITEVAHGVAGVPTTIDERAEVALLTRNIKIQGASDSEGDGFGGHIMVMDDASVAKLKGVELYRMGQRGLLGRYPMHWHNVNDGGANSWMRNCSTHHSFNRGTTIHKTNGVTVSDNVVFDTIGHGMFLEDGKETGNLFERNLVALVHVGPIDQHFDPNSSRSHMFGSVPAAFWISNPNNNFIGNVAAGSAPGGFGFWYDVHSDIRPNSISVDPAYHPINQPFGVFRDNRAHSVTRGNGPLEHGWAFNVEFMQSTDASFTIDNFTSFRCSGQVWVSGGSTQFYVANSKLVGDIAVFNPALLIDSLALGGSRGEAPARMALSGYDSVAPAFNCVFGSFRGVYKLRNPAAEWFSQCTFLNSGGYTTNLIANVDNLTPDDAARRMFFIEDPEDSFGNGYGLFTYTELLTDASSKRAWEVAGLEQTDPLAWWSPFLMTDFVTFHFGLAPYKVQIQPAGKTRVFETAQDGGTQHAYAKLDVAHNITFTGPVVNETLALTVFPAEAQNGRKLLLNLPASSTSLAFSSQIYNSVYPVLQAASVAEFEGGNGVTVFQDGSLLRVKLPVHLNSLTISGYTLP